MPATSRVWRRIPVCLPSRSPILRYNRFFKRKARLAPGQFDVRLDPFIVSPLPPACNGAMRRSDLWQEMSEKFRRLDTAGCLRLEWSHTPPLRVENFELIETGDHCRSVRVQFEGLARRAALLLEIDGSKPLERWFTKLKDHDYGGKPEIIYQPNIHGVVEIWKFRIMNVCNASADLCSELVSATIEIESDQAAREEIQTALQESRSLPAIKGKPDSDDRGWAACPQVEYISSLDVPKFFTTEEQARKFVQSFPSWPRSRLQERKQSLADVKAGKITHLPYQLIRKRRGQSGWAYIPIKPLVIAPGRKVRRFRDFLPLDQVGKVPEETLEDVVERAYDDLFPKPLCFLAAEWDFAKIQDHAKRLPGHEFSGRSHRDITDIVLKAVYDFEDSLHFFYPELSAISTADFYTSWQLWRHIAELCNRIGESAVGKKLAGDPGSSRKRATAGQSFLYIQLTSYAHQIRSSSPQIPGADSNNFPAVDGPLTSEILQTFLTAIDEQDTILIESYGKDANRLIPASHWTVIKKEVFDRISARVGSFPALNADLSQGVVHSSLRAARNEIIYLIRRLESGMAAPPGHETGIRPDKGKRAAEKKSKDRHDQNASVKRRRRSSMIESPSAVEKLEKHLMLIRNQKGFTATDFAGLAGIGPRTLHDLRKTKKARPDTFRAIAKAMKINLETLLEQ